MIVVGLYAIIEGLHRTLGRGGLLLLLSRRGAKSEQSAGNDNHDESKKTVHYWASRRTTGSRVSEAGKSMVSAMWRRPGKRMRRASAKTTVAMGSVPQRMLSHSVGTAPGGGVILCAGGTSSFVHSVMFPLS